MFRRKNKQYKLTTPKVNSSPDRTCQECEHVSYNMMGEFWCKNSDPPYRSFRGWNTPHWCPLLQEVENVQE